MDDLKPCPWCGGTDLAHEDFGFNGLGALKCTACGAMGPTAENPNGHKNAERAWNTRAQLDTPAGKDAPYMAKVRGALTACASKPGCGECANEALRELDKAMQPTAKDRVFNLYQKFIQTLDDETEYGRIKGYTRLEITTRLRDLHESLKHVGTAMQPPSHDARQAALEAIKPNAWGWWQGTISAEHLATIRATLQETPEERAKRLNPPITLSQPAQTDASQWYKRIIDCIHPTPGGENIKFGENSYGVTEPGFKVDFNNLMGLIHEMTAQTDAGELSGDWIINAHIDKICDMALSDDACQAYQIKALKTIQRLNAGRAIRNAKAGT